jgi:hypothetical protein
VEQKFIKYIHDFSKSLIAIHGFKIKTEINDGRYYLIEYSSIDFVIKIEKYFRELYVSLYKLSDPNNEINLFNLLEYLKQGNNVPKSKYFHEEKDLEECYRKQLMYISNVFYENFIAINDYFSSNNYALNIVDMKNFRKNKYPELYNNFPSSR